MGMTVSDVIKALVDQERDNEVVIRWFNSDPISVSSIYDDADGCTVIEVGDAAETEEEASTADRKPSADWMKHPTGVQKQK